MTGAPGGGGATAGGAAGSAPNEDQDVTNEDVIKNV